MHCFSVSAMGGQHKDDIPGRHTCSSPNPAVFERGYVTQGHSGQVPTADPEMLYSTGHHMPKAPVFTSQEWTFPACGGCNTGQPGGHGDSAGMQRTG